MRLVSPNGVDPMERITQDYLIYDLIQRHNVVRSDEPITMRRAIAIRDRIMRGSNSPDYNWDTFWDRYREAVRVENIEPNWYSRNNDNREIMESFDFVRVSAHVREMCWQEGMTQRYPDGSAVVELNDSGVIPISPYSPIIRGRRVSLKTGHRLLGLRNGDATDLGDAFSQQRVGEPVQLLRNVSYNSERKSYSASGVVPAVDPTDAWHIARLAPYITTAEMDRITRAFSRLPQPTPEQSRAYAQMAAMGAGICEYVNHKYGLQAKIVLDDNPGQLKAVLPNGVHIRVMDTLENSGYVGRVYDGGISTYMSSTLYNSGTTTHAGLGPYGMLTTEQVQRVIDVAMGSNIKVTREAGQAPQWLLGNGAPLTRTRLRGGKPYQENTVSVGANGLRVTGSVLPGDRFGNYEVINVNASQARRSHIYFASTTDAAEWLNGAVASAQRNYLDRLNVEGIAAQLEGGDEVVFDTEDDIASVQHYLIDEVRSQMDEGPIDVRAALDELALEDARARLSDGQTYSPTQIIRFMDGADSPTAKTANFVYAAQMVGLRPDQFRLDDAQDAFILDNTRTFNPLKARDMVGHDNEFIDHMGREIRKTLAARGATDVSIKIDEDGVVYYTGMVNTAARAGLKQPQLLKGTIGQVIAPDERGVVYSRNLSGENFAVIPGYSARVVPATGANADKNMDERIRLSSYRDQMALELRRMVNRDVAMFVRSGGESEVGAATSVNYVLRNAVGERLEPNFIEAMREQGMDESLIEDIIATHRARVRLPNEFGQEATVAAQYFAQTGMRNPTDDMSGDAFSLSGGQNVAVVAGSKVFDNRVTTVTSTNQGLIRYLKKGAQVDSNGSIVVDENTAEGCALSENPIVKGVHTDKDAADRFAMVVNGIMTANSVAQGVKMAQMPMSGWNQDDGVVVSQHFADTHMVRSSETGELRPLTVGDKISNMHGNKGVITLIVDPEDEMSAASHEIRELFAKNDLDIVMSPYSALSRRNGGTAREAMMNPSDLKLAGDQVVEGGIGSISVILTDKTADEKTSIYDDEAVKQGKGRKVSAMLGTLLVSAKCDKILNYVYGPNDAALADLRQHLIMCGMDLDETGHLRQGFHEHEGEWVQTIQLPDVPARVQKDGTESFDTKAARQALDEIITYQGGMVQLPFEIKLRTGEMTDQLPLLSAKLRSGREFEDGSVSKHDYTYGYIDAISAAMRYQFEKDHGASAAELAKWQAKTQFAFDRIVDDVMDRRLTGKHSLIRDSIMGRRMPKSATALMTADSRLGIDEIGVSPQIADTLGVKNGDFLLNWRDPILHAGALSASRVVIDERLTGVSLNPVVVPRKDGDFDGDQLGIMALPRGRFDDEMRSLMVSASLEDPEKPGEIYLSKGLDYRLGRLDAGLADNKPSDSAAQIDENVRQAFAHANPMVNGGKGVISFANPTAHIESLKAACELGGKGGNIDTYANDTGFVPDGKGGYDYAPADAPSPLNSVEAIAGSQFATAVKSHTTGNAGAVTQRTLLLVPDQGGSDPEQVRASLNAAMQGSRAMTQLVLSSKHSGEKANNINYMVRGVLAPAFDGALVTRTDRGYKVKRDEQVDADKWAQMVSEICVANGLPDNSKYLQQLAKPYLGGTMPKALTNESRNPLYRLAFTQNPQNWLDMAKRGEQLFTGVVGGAMMPNKVRDNIARLERDQGEKLHSFTKADVQEGYSDPKAQARIEWDRTLRERDAAKAASAFKPDYSDDTDLENAEAEPAEVEMEL